MVSQTVVDDTGCVAIPPAILKRLGLTPGARVELELLGDAGLLLHPAETTPQFVDRNGVLVARGVPTEDLTDLETRERDDRLAQFVPGDEP